MMMKALGFISLGFALTISTGWGQESQALRPKTQEAYLRLMKSCEIPDVRTRISLTNSNLAEITAKKELLKSYGNSNPSSDVSSDVSPDVSKDQRAIDFFERENLQMNVQNNRCRVLYISDLVVKETDLKKRSVLKKNLDIARNSLQTAQEKLANKENNLAANKAKAELEKTTEALKTGLNSPEESSSKPKSSRNFNLTGVLRKVSRTFEKAANYINPSSRSENSKSRSGASVAR